METERLDAISNFLTAAVSHQMRQVDLRNQSDKAEKPYRRMVGELFDLIRDGIRRGEVSPDAGEPDRAAARGGEVHVP